MFSVGAGVTLILRWHRAAGGIAPRLVTRRTGFPHNELDPTPVAHTTHGRDSGGYILRLLCSRADKCAPVSKSRPVRKAQNIRLADSANGP
jgi:hypothetical protein